MKVVLCDSTTINSYGFRTDVKGKPCNAIQSQPATGNRQMGKH